MNIRPVSQWIFYRYRRTISYTFLALVVALLLVTYIDQIPLGFTPLEQQSVVASGTISFTQLPTQIVDLPYHILQKLSVDFFGVTPIGVRLPSLIFGAATAVCMALILRRWFQINVAIAASLIVLTSSWFLSISRLGAPLIMIAFWTSLLILAATYISQQTPRWRWWKVNFALAAGLSLYTPFMIYLFLATIIAAFAQPHLRYLLYQSSKARMTVSMFLGALLLVPLGWGIYTDLSVVRELLAIPAALPDPLQFGHNLLQAIGNLVSPFAVSFGEAITPTLTIVFSLFALAGGIRLLKDFHSVRAYVLLIWMALLVPIIAFNPNNLTVLLVPAMLAMAIGIQLIFRYWYRLFPRNPYARVFGLLPLAVLIIVTLQFNYQRYFYGLFYSPQAAVTANDPFVAQKEIKRLPSNTPLTIVVAEQDVPIYQLAVRNHPKATVTTTEHIDLLAGTWLIAEGEVGKMGTLPAPVASKLVVNDRRESALRFRLYNR